jgi:hypothetical protein
VRTRPRRSARSATRAWSSRSPPHHGRQPRAVREAACRGAQAARDATSRSACSSDAQVADAGARATPSTRSARFATRGRSRRSRTALEDPSDGRSRARGRDARQARRRTRREVAHRPRAASKTDAYGVGRTRCCACMQAATAELDSDSLQAVAHLESVIAGPVLLPSASDRSPARPRSPSTAPRCRQARRHRRQLMRRRRVRTTVIA